MHNPYTEEQLKAFKEIYYRTKVRLPKDNRSMTPEFTVPLERKYFLREFFSARSLGKKRDEEIEKDLRGGIGEIAWGSFLDYPDQDYLKQYIESLPQNNNGDPGYDIIHNGFKIEVKATRTTYCEFKIPGSIKSKEKPCDYFAFCRLANIDLGQKADVTGYLIGFAPYEVIMEALEPCGSDYTVDTQRLCEEGLLDTNAYRLLNL